MKKALYFAAMMAAGMLVSGLAACRKEETKVSAAAAPEQVPLEPVLVGIQPDGLGYLPGSSTPFTGEAILPFPDMPWLAKQKERFVGGKRDGDKVELYKSGRTKSLRRYEMGVPKYAASFYPNGQMKFEAPLNAHDKAEGPYKRWHENGTLESTATMDGKDQWDGEKKEWTEAGELQSHLVFRHGVLEKIIFETPEAAEARKAAGMEPEQAAAPPRAVE